MDRTGVGSESTKRICGGSGRGTVECQKVRWWRRFEPLIAHHLIACRRRNPLHRRRIIQVFTTPTSTVHHDLELTVHPPTSLPSRPLKSADCACRSPPSILRPPLRINALSYPLHNHQHVYTYTIPSHPMPAPPFPFRLYYGLSLPPCTSPTPPSPTRNALVWWRIQPICRSCPCCCRFAAHPRVLLVTHSMSYR